MTPRGADALTAIGLVALLAGVALTAPRWAAALRVPAATIEDEAATEGAAPAQQPASAPVARRINVRLYFEWTELDGLGSEEREIAFSPDLAQQLRTVIDELAKGPSAAALGPTLPAGTRVLEVFVRDRGVVYVDLSGELRTGSPGGSRAELLTAYSIVNTIVTNFPATSRVQLLVDDQPVRSLVGHVDLSRPLQPDLTLVALGPPRAEAGSGARPVGESKEAR